MKKKAARGDPLANLFAKLRPSPEKLAAVKAAERSGDTARFTELLAELDRASKVRSVRSLALDRKLVNDKASRVLAEAERAVRVAPPTSAASILAQLAGKGELACDCVVPFQFQRLDVYGAMSGPEQDEVARGMLGAMRWYANEYTVWNPGDTDGKTRVPMYGQMHISFGATIPRGGRWCLVHPSGTLLLRGHSRVVGHGNMTTSYDAKVWVDYFQVLQVGGNLLEISGGQIHYDGTRSEDRTKYFTADRFLPPRSLFFNAQAGTTLLLTLRVEIDTEANEDGIATGVVDQFGFLANSTGDYDTFVVKAP